ncbi:PREDICTED: melatonin receptor type 1B-A-like [Branchiostoma belcheri]|uniref:Melatonin receptor type 1B-A-like n=1 Tax=Branchiostoma belcheri TaxID=7741 RepID=A0A6P5AP32_BRABE|nr:PREDICTED: melatonin receptor type 1B-A-like [Branchiostoma belcheri]
MATDWDYAFTVIIGIIIVATVIGNLLLIVVILKNKELKKAINIPLASLSSSDIIFAILLCFWAQNHVYPEWETPAALCWLIGYLTPVIWAVASWHMLCIVLTSYFKICTNSTRLKSTRTVGIMLFFTWLIPAVTILPLVIIEEVKLDPKLKQCGVSMSEKLWAKLLVILINFFIPFIGAFVFYGLIENHVRKSKERVEANKMAGLKPNRLAVQYSRGQKDDASPSTSNVTITTPPQNPEDKNVRDEETDNDGVGSEMYKNSSDTSSDEEQNVTKSTGVHITSPPCDCVPDYADTTPDTAPDCADTTPDTAPDVC